MCFRAGVYTVRRDESGGQEITFPGGRVNLGLESAFHAHADP